MYRPSRLVRDATGGYKIEVSLPGGRYQLSLDDRAVNVLLSDLGLEIRDTVPDTFVPFFVAIGDAWFPRERDTDAIIADLAMGNSLSDTEMEVLVSYVTDSLIPERNERRVKTLIADSPLAEKVDTDELRINELPSIPEWSSLSESDTDGLTPHVDEAEEPGDATQPGSAAESGDEASTTGQQAVETAETESVKDLQEIPGIGPQRAEAFVQGGVCSVSTLADARPVELSSIDGITEDIAAVAVEGAREVVGQREPASERLAADTTATEPELEAALASLAASGVPATEATPTLRVLFGPTVADVAAVSGQQAYYLWEAGYQTPRDVLGASVEELTDVYQIGETTAVQIQESAQELLDSVDD